MDENEEKTLVSLEDVVQAARGEYIADPTPEKLKALTALEKELLADVQARAERIQKSHDADLDRQARAEIEAARIDAEATQAEADREQRDKQHKTSIIKDIAIGAVSAVCTLAGIGLAVLANSRDNRQSLEEQAYEFDTAARLEKEEDVIFRTNASRQRYKHKVHNVPVKK